MYAIIYLLAGATTAIVALVAIWAARSRIHWFWRAAALLTCFLLLVPVGAAELNLLFAPVAGILFLASAGEQWWERRKQRLSAKAGDESGGPPSIRAEDSPTAMVSGPNRLPTPSVTTSSVRFSLRELFLAILLAAVAAWIVARIVQEGVLLDWRKLPIAVALVSAVAWTAFWWADKPRPWRAGYAIPISYLAGFGMAALSIYALPYWFNWYSTSQIAIAATVLSLATIAAVYLWLVHVGRIGPTIVLFGAVGGAAFAHLHLLGDWLRADYLLLALRPRFWWEWGFCYCVVYFYLAIFVVVGVALARAIQLPRRESWRISILSGLSLATFTVAIVPLALQYWQLLETPQFTAENRGTVNSLDEANKILLTIQRARKKLPPGPPSPSDVLALHQSEAAAQLAPQLFAILEKPGYVSREWGTAEKEAAIQGQLVEANQMLGLAREFLGPASYTARPSADENSQYCLAWIRYANYSQRGALAWGAWHGYTSEGGGHLWLAQHGDELSPERRRDILSALREIDRSREPLQVLLDRDAAWSERRQKWRGRLERVVLGIETRPIDPLLPCPNVREVHDNCVAIARLNMTDVAIRMFHTDKGRWPSSLQDLIPDYLDSVPVDPYSNEAIVYRPTDGSFVLYGVGSDGEDDGGDTYGFDWTHWVHFPSRYKGDLDLQTIVREVNAIQAKAKSGAATAPLATPPPAAQSGGKSAAVDNP